ncbi:GDSL-type esterase/lipase family protein [Arenibacter sp. 6A1]|uniref:GDSL-type esterase/lipase family protein n=1 Tax=Arenibacter sp. 6A1 TaxID=2720391 RepID=UPI00293BC481|nr:GDSL-type esterase/lipase family protein [Arenibacter sp. 6A1]
MSKILYLSLFLSAFIGYTQQNIDFRNEVLAIQQKYDTLWDSSKETVVFTGSSSIRTWKNLESMFPNHQIINSGFGGSESLDLLGYHHELILRYNPKKVFIYEGDNDIARGVSIKKIMTTTRQIIQKLKEENKDIQIVLISTKPSIARWHLRKKYLRLNKKIEKLCTNDPKVFYADVWSPMVDGKKLRKDIFLKDGLHMNDLGYSLWFSVINPLMN